MIDCHKLSLFFFSQEHVMKCQDQAEVDRIQANVEKSRKALQTLGYADLTFEDFFAVTFLLQFLILVGYLLTF